MAPASSGRHCCFKALQAAFPAAAESVPPAGESLSEAAKMPRCGVSQHQIEYADGCEQHHDGNQPYVLAAAFSLVVYFFLFVFHNRYSFISTGKYSVLSARQSCGRLFFTTKPPQSSRLWRPVYLVIFVLLMF